MVSITLGVGGLRELSPHAGPHLPLAIFSLHRKNVKKITEHGLDRKQDVRTCATLALTTFEAVFLSALSATRGGILN